MGMYTNLYENINLEYDAEKLKELDSRLYWILTGMDEAKFYGYWTLPYIQSLHELGKQGIIKGECILQYEEGDLIMCKWDEKGFYYAMGDDTFKGDMKNE